MEIRSSKATAFVIAAFMLLASTAPIAAQDQAQPYPELNQQLKQLKAQFNADVGKVRVVVIGDPTCPPCRRTSYSTARALGEKSSSSCRRPVNSRQKRQARENRGDTMGLTFTTAFIAGMLSFISPCILPLAPGYVAMISGLSVEQLRDKP